MSHFLWGIVSNASKKARVAARLTEEVGVAAVVPRLQLPSAVDQDERPVMGWVGMGCELAMGTECLNGCGNGCVWVCDSVSG